MVGFDRGGLAGVCGGEELVEVVDDGGAVAGALTGGLELVLTGCGALPLRTKGGEEDIASRTDTGLFMVHCKFRQGWRSSTRSSYRVADEGEED